MKDKEDANKKKALEKTLRQDRLTSDNKKDIDTLVFSKLVRDVYSLYTLY